jgi:hypothetical protein
MVAIHPEGAQGEFTKLGLPVYGYVFLEGHEILQETIDKETMWIAPNSKADKDLDRPVGQTIPRRQLVEGDQAGVAETGRAGSREPESAPDGRGPPSPRRSFSTPVSARQAGCPGAVMSASDDFRDFIPEFEILPAR